MYDYLTAKESLNTTNVTKILSSNIELLNNTMADWVMTSRYSIEFMKLLPEDRNSLSLYFFNIL